MALDILSDFRPLGRLIGLVRPHLHIVLGALVCDIFKPALTISIGICGVLLIKQAMNPIDAEYVLPLTGLMLVLALARGFFGYFGIFLNHVAAFRILETLRKHFFLCMKPLTPGLMVSRRTGDLVSVAMNNIDMLELFFAHTLNPLIVSVVIPVACLLVLWWIHPLLALILLVFLIIFQIVPIILVRANSSTANEMRISLGVLNSYLIDSIQGVWETLAFGREDVRYSGLDTRVQRFNDLQNKFIRKNAFTTAGNIFIVSLGILSILLVARSLITTSGLQPLYIPVCIIITAGAFGSVGSIVDISKQLSLTLTGAKRFFEITDMEPEVQEKLDAHPPKSGAVDISIHDLKFRYDLQSADVLKGISLKIPEGKTVALVGMTGAGKTTLIHLILRFWDPTQGNILIGGQDIRDYPLEYLRNQISVVAQDVFLFDSSIKDNILIGKPSASDDELIRVAKMAQIHEFVTSLPQGYDTLIGERGIRLSGGERQRIAIARAILKNAPILILDEATSNLDTENENLIKDALKVLATGKTVLIIAHRLSTVVHADTIFVLNDGEIEESGNHEELIRKNGLYAKLCRIFDNGKET
nr:thiol reductant ABC exporter subunit CydC [uncultured Methanospirillum sp.]